MVRVETPQSICRFGLARCDVTPPVGIYHRMWGAAAHDRSEGVHRPLTATAMVFQQCGDPSSAGVLPLAKGELEGVNQQVIIAIDHCLLGLNEVNRLLDEAATRAGIARQSIVVTFSHTHAAGLLNLDRADFPGGDLIPGYLDELTEKVAETVAQAAAQLTDVTMTYGTGRCNLAAHRDLFDEVSQQWVCGYNPDGAADDTVLVVRITGEDGKLIATCVDYACHPTTLAWDNRLISPDYPGAMREVVEQTTGAPCVFLQGTSGDLGPVDGYVGDTQVADRNGRQLAYAALSALESLPPAKTFFEYAGPVLSGATIGAWHHVAIDAPRQQQLAQWQTNRETIPLPYREDLPTLAQVESQRQQLLDQEQTQRDAGNDAEAAQARALVERQTRMLGRLKCLPEGGEFPYHATILRIGDAIWLTVQGEPYQQLQQELRDRFPDSPIVVASIANGWGPSYMPPRDVYGKGVYQESIAALAPGCLETAIDTLSARIGEMIDDSAKS